MIINRCKINWTRALNQSQFLLVRRQIRCMSTLRLNVHHQHKTEAQPPTITINRCLHILRTLLHHLHLVHLHLGFLLLLYMVIVTDMDRVGCRVRRMCMRFCVMIKFFRLKWLWRLFDSLYGVNLESWWCIIDGNPGGFLSWWQRNCMKYEI